MTGKKRKSVNDAKEVKAYRRKLQRPFKLSNKERKKYTFQFPFSQEFSLPSNILYYVSQNPKINLECFFQKGHLKLISTCKSLARMSRIFPVKRLQHFNDDDCNTWNADDGESINLKDKLFKLWIYDEASICANSIPNLASTLIKTCYKFSLRKLKIDFQILTFGELQILVSEGHLEKVWFYENVIKNSDGSIVEFEKVFELLCCEKMGFSLHDVEHGIGKNTANKIIEILSSYPRIYNIEDITLWNITQNFDFRLFFKFLKANINGRYKIVIHLSDEISDVYRNELQQFVNEIIQLRIYDRSTPLIEFTGQDEEAFETLDRMHETVHYEH